MKNNTSMNKIFICKKCYFHSLETPVTNHAAFHCEGDLIEVVPSESVTELKELVWKAKGLILVLARNDKDFEMCDPWMEEFEKRMKGL